MTEDRLYWAETGEVTCGKHAPFRGSDTWKAGRWSAMRETDRNEWAAVTGQPARCEVCPTGGTKE